MPSSSRDAGAAVSQFRFISTALFAKQMTGCSTLVYVVDVGCLKSTVLKVDNAKPQQVGTVRRLANTHYTLHI